MTTLAFVIFDGLGCSLGGSLSGILYKTSKFFSYIFGPRIALNELFPEIFDLTKLDIEASNQVCKD